MNNQVEHEHVCTHQVKGIGDPGEVPEQDIGAQEGDVAEENPGDHQDRRENSHDGSIGKLLKRIEFLLGRRPEGIFFPFKNGDQVKPGLF